MEYYIVFCITTAILANTYWITPLIDALKSIRPSHDIANSPYLTHFVFFLIGIALAPLLFLPVVVPSLRKDFYNKFLATMIEEI